LALFGSASVLPAAFVIFSVSAPAVSAAAARSIQSKEISFPDGKLREKYSYYLDEKKHEVKDGLDEEYFNSGAKKGEILWQDGKENGPVVYYYADGRKSYEANYREGKKNGYATVWYPTGQKQWQTVFRDGLTNGVWREWYQDGKKKFEANYNDGKLEGLATWWHETGRLWQERSFQAGVLVKGSVREWDKAGHQTFPPPENGQETGYDDPPADAVHQDTVAGSGMRKGN
jgi:antitoxin component YwqK of YwqJK toxin-antitoxin module